MLKYESVIKPTPLSGNIKMPLKTKQPGQFIALLTGDTVPSPSKRHNQNIIVANEHDDILRLIATTQFDLILLDLTVNGHSRQSELIDYLKDPLGINSKTPIIAITGRKEKPQNEKQYPVEFDDWLIKPITEERLNEILDIWQTKASVFNYTQIILSKTKNNPHLALTIFEKLFEELPLQLIQIKDALENSQYDLAREITHKLNGSVSFCGLLKIRQPANDLEICLLNNDYADTHQYFLTLQQCILNFTRHQKAILTNLGQS